MLIGSGKYGDVYMSPSTINDVTTVTTVTKFMKFLDPLKRDQFIEMDENLSIINLKNY